MGLKSARFWPIHPRMVTQAPADQDRKDRVLVVDDEVQVAKCLRRLLQREGFEVAIAFGPEEALSLLDEFRPDLVITDFRMPRMNGAELLAEIKRRMPLTLGVIASGCTDVRAVPTGVNVEELCRFLQKPWDDRELIAQIRLLLSDPTV